MELRGDLGGVRAVIWGHFQLYLRAALRGDGGDTAVTGVHCSHTHSLEGSHCLLWALSPGLHCPGTLAWKECFGLEGTLKPISFLWAETPPIRPGCSKLHPVWAWTFPGMGHPQLHPCSLAVAEVHGVLWDGDVEEKRRGWLHAAWGELSRWEGARSWKGEGLIPNSLILTPSIKWSLSGVQSCPGYRNSDKSLENSSYWDNRG